MFKQKKFILVISLLVITASLLALKRIRKLEDPVLNLPFYAINVFAPGATSTNFENDIITTLKDEIENIEDLEETVYTVRDNYFTVKIEAAATVNVDEKLNELKRIVNSLSLPDYVKKTVVKKINPLDVSVLQLAIHQDKKVFDYKLNKIGNILKEKIKSIKGVSRVNVHGERKQVVSVILDQGRLSAINIPIGLVQRKIEERFSIVPSGKVNNDIYALAVKTTYGFENLKAIRNLIISNDRGNLLYLRDFATILLEEQRNNKYHTQLNDFPCVFVTATAKKDANLFHIASEAEMIMNSFKGSYEGVSIVKVFDQSVSVDEKLSDLSWNIIQGILLIALIIYAVLGFRNAMIAGVIIPISIIAAVGLLYALGFALQQISIAALIISIGLVIDDNIVIIENIHRLMRSGASRSEAIVKGVKSIMWPVINSSVTTALVFFPMMNLGGRTGQYIKTLPITVCLCLFTSLFFSIILTPILCDSFLLSSKSKTNFQHKVSGLTKRYESFLIRVLSKPKKVLVSIMLIIGLSVLLFKIVGVSLFPPADKPILLIDIELPKGGALETTKTVTQRVLALIKKEHPEVNCTLNIGQGNPKLYYNIFPKKFQEDYAQIVVFLDHWENEHFQVLKAELEQAFKSKIKNARITVKELMNGPPIASPIVIKLMGEDTKSLQEGANSIVSLLKSDVEISQIESPYDDLEFSYHMNLDLEKMSRFGLSNSVVNRNLYMLLSGYEIEDVNINGTVYPLKLRLSSGVRDKRTYEDLSNDLLVQSPLTKAYIPFNTFSSIQLKKEMGSIEYYNGKRAVTITCDVSNKEVNTLEKTNELIEKINSLQLNGVSLEYGGAYKTSNKSFGGVLIVLIIALFGIYAVLVLQFKSYGQPFIVLIAIPLAFVGAILMLFLFKESFSFLAFIGFTSISGIVINNSMLLVDTFNKLKESGLPNEVCVLQSSTQRFLPIMITSVTTICGLIPMIISGSNLWRPLALTIVGGMLSSTLLVIVLIPILLNKTQQPKK